MQSYFMTDGLICSAPSASMQGAATIPIRTGSVPNGSGGAWSSASYTRHIISST